MSDSCVSFEQSDSGTLPALPTEEFVQQFTRAQRSVFLHILAMVGNPLDAEEILQETNVVIWAKFQQFRPGTNFLAWARQIASFEVLKFRERCHRDKRVFSTEFIETVASVSEENRDLEEQRRRALFECIKKLPSTDRELIQKRYAPGASGKSVAKSLGRPANSVYQSLGRIRRVLLECVRRRLATEGQTL